MASELQQAFQMDLPGTLFDGHMFLVLGIMVAAGVLAGSANYYLTENPDDDARRTWLRYVVFGVVAALTVPLFLNMISSTLLENTRHKPSDVYVFAGFCLVYVLASRRAFELLAQRLLDRLEAKRGEASRSGGGGRLQAVEERKAAEPIPVEALSNDDIGILRALAGDSVVYGNLAEVCERTGLARELASQRLATMKALGVLETRINDKNVLLWVVSPRGRAVLEECAPPSPEKKLA